MDGVLVDGEPLHFRALNELLAAEGRAITLDEYRPYMGTKAGWAEFVADFGLRHTKEHYAPLYHELVLRQYQAELDALPGALEAVRLARLGAGRIALASSSERSWVDTCLARIGLWGAFDAVVTGTDIQHGKPAPDIYLLSAERLAVDPVRCLAIEDAPAGIASAKAAGMTCWAVRTEYTHGLDLGAPDRVLPSLEALTAADFQEMAA
jgi:HAD superfamily hydrolase (TIGR01509 family)